MVSIGGSGPRDMLVLAARLANADKDLRAQLSRRFRAAAEPVAADARQAILTAGPVHYERRLRAETAATVRTEVNLPVTGVRVSILSEGTKMPPDKANLPHLMDVGHWRHPVFGDRQTWVGQLSVRPGWFTLTCLAGAPAFNQAAVAAMDEVAQQIGGGL